MLKDTSKKENPTLDEYIKSETQKVLSTPSDETEALLNHLDILTKYSEQNNLSYTGYFLEKAAEALVDLERDNELEAVT